MGRRGCRVRSNAGMDQMRMNDPVGLGHGPDRGPASRLSSLMAATPLPLLPQIQIS